MSIRMKLILFSFLIVFVPIAAIAFIVSHLVVKDLSSEMVERLEAGLIGLSYDLGHVKEDVLFDVERILANKALINKVALANRGVDNGLLEEIGEITGTIKAMTALDFLEVSDKKRNLVSVSSEIYRKATVDKYGFEKTLGINAIVYHMVDNSLFLIASVPLMENNEMVGVAIGGKKITSAFVDFLSLRVGADVNFFYNKKYVVGKSPSFDLEEVFINEIKSERQLHVFNTKVTVDKKSYLLMASPLMLNEDGYLLGITLPYSAAVAKGSRARVVILLIATGVALMAAVLALIFVNYLNKPIQKLHEATKEISAGNFDVKVEVISRDEIGDLARAFNFMIQQVKESFEKIGVQIEELKKAAIYIDAMA